MNLVKLSLAAAAAALTFSCSQATPPPNTTSATNAKTSPTTVAAVPPQNQNRPVGNIDAKKRLQAAAAVDDEIAPEGDDVYATNCMICHKDTGKGGKVTIKGKSLNAEDLTTEKMKKLTDEKLFEYVSDGVPDEGMPSFKGKLSDDQIRTAVARIRGLQAK